MWVSPELDFPFFIGLSSKIWKLVNRYQQNLKREENKQFHKEDGVEQQKHRIGVGLSHSRSWLRNGTLLFFVSYCLLGQQQRRKFENLIGFGGFAICRLFNFSPSTHHFCGLQIVRPCQVSWA